MKNIGASVSDVLTQEQKEAEVKKQIEEEEEEERILMENEVVFYLKEAPEYRISALGRWLETPKGEVIGNADTYFLHVLTNQRCESVRDCFSGWSEQDERSAEQWETLCSRIEEYGNLEETICDEKRVEV